MSGDCSCNECCAEFDENDIDFEAEDPDQGISGNCPVCGSFDIEVG